MQKNLKIIFEDNHLLVVNKPALLPTMGVSPEKESLIALAKRYLKQKYDKPGNVYLGVVSRLDAFVSGVVVFARTSKSAARLNKQFANSEPKKKYWAIVPSRNCEAARELEHWVTKDEANHRMMTVENSNHHGAKLAKLSYQTISTYEDLSLLEILLLTGRKHQIRVQLSASNSAIIGDRKYGSPVRFHKGIALHSHSLTIEHPVSKSPQTFTAEPPGYWQLENFFRR